MSDKEHLGSKDQSVNKGQMFNSLTLSAFNQSIYSDILAEDNLYGDEKASSGETNGIRTGFTMKKGNKVYFVPSKYVYQPKDPDDEESEIISILPIRVHKTIKIIDRSSVYHFVKKAKTIKLKGKKTMSFRELVDSFCNWEHTNPLHFSLYKILCIIGYVGRSNWRLATKFSFGKDGVVDALRDLTNNCARIDKATPAKLDFVLKFPFILCNEIASLKREEKEVFLQFGLSAGAKQNKYTKPTRKSRGTKEIYDISKLSLCFTYNIAKYYQDKGLASFDDYFPEQFLDRFIPFKLSGFLKVGQFKRAGEFDYEETAKKYKAEYIKILEMIVYLCDHPLKPKYDMPEHIKFGTGKTRWKNDFKFICTFLGYYAQNKSEYLDLVEVLYQSHKDYMATEIHTEHPVLVKEEVIK